MVKLSKGQSIVLTIRSVPQDAVIRKQDTIDPFYWPLFSSKIRAVYWRINYCDSNS